MTGDETTERTISGEGRSLTDQVYRALKEDILAARIGSEPIVQDAIAKEYGVSKTPVREALRQLAHDGLVVVMPRKGYLVRPMGVSDIIEVMDLRRIVEPPLAAAAARNRTPEHVAQIEQLLKQDRSGSTSLDELLESLHEHEFIAEMAGNGRATTLVRALLDETARVPWLTPGLRVRLNNDDHSEIFAAIIRGDPEDAEQKMAEHLDEVKVTTLEGLGAR